MGLIPRNYNRGALPVGLAVDGFQTVDTDPFLMRMINLGGWVNTNNNDNVLFS
jgi:hypothetical protein